MIEDQISQIFEKNNKQFMSNKTYYCQIESQQTESVLEMHQIKREYLSQTYIFNKNKESIKKKIEGNILQESRYNN